MSAGSVGGSEQERLSALLDGEVDGAACAAACAGWTADAALRQDWHAWHLIGDVLRSEDLASSPVRDARFLAELRGRLASEPVVLAPAPLPTGAAEPTGQRRTGRWLVPSAVAAGFVLVAGTFGMLRIAGQPAAPAPTLASAAPAALAPVRTATLPEPAEPAQEIVASGKLIRDAQLDRYLAAHKQFAGTSALGVPSAFLRSATVHAEPR